MVRDIHAIGFSLGAHVAAFASNAIEQSVGHRFDRITGKLNIILKFRKTRHPKSHATGLDPALPFFASGDINWKLDKTDAGFVDIIHTNAGIFGKIEPSGHVDYYVNGGQIQPACVNHKSKYIQKS